MKMYISRFPRRFTTLTPHTPPPQPAVPKIAQAPNRLTPWNTTQTEKDKVMKKEARFNQTDISKQPNPLAAISLISQVPIIKIQNRIAVCDGGGGPLGHPRIYINLDKPEARSCGYCGLRFEKEAEEHH